MVKKKIVEPESEIERLLKENLLLNSLVKEMKALAEKNGSEVAFWKHSALRLEEQLKKLS